MKLVWEIKSIVGLGGIKVDIIWNFEVFLSVSIKFRRDLLIDGFKQKNISKS